MDKIVDQFAGAGDRREVPPSSLESLVPSGDPTAAGRIVQLIAVITVLSVAPGVYFNAGGSVWLFMRGQVPVYKHLLGEQDVKPSVAAGVQFQAF